MPLKGCSISCGPLSGPLCPSPPGSNWGPQATKAHLTSKGLVDLKDVHVIHGQPCRPGEKT